MEQSKSMRRTVRSKGRASGKKRNKSKESANTLPVNFGIEKSESEPLIKETTMSGTLSMSKKQKSSSPKKKQQVGFQEDVGERSRLLLLPKPTEGFD